MRASQRVRAVFALTLLFACASSAHAAVTGFCDYMTLSVSCALMMSSSACTGDCTWNAGDSACEAPASGAVTVLSATDAISRAWSTQVLACTAENNDQPGCDADSNCEYDSGSGDCSVTEAFTLSKYATCASTSAGERTRVGFVAPATAFVAATALAALA